MDPRLEKVGLTAQFSGTVSIMGKGATKDMDVGKKSGALP
jgi:hypothetical protein